MTDHVASESVKVDSTETPAPKTRDPGRGPNLTPKSEWGRGWDKDMHHKQWERKLEQMFRRQRRA